MDYRAPSHAQRSFLSIGVKRFRNRRFLPFDKSLREALSIYSDRLKIIGLIALVNVLLLPLLFLSQVVPLALLLPPALLLIVFICASIGIHSTKTIQKTWSLRWLATPIAYLFPKDDREEWLGCLTEMHYELIEQEHYPYWLVNAITVGRILLLVWSAVEVKVLNLISRIRGT